MNETQLRIALDAASAHVQAPQLAREALVQRSRRLRRRRGIIAAMMVLLVAVPSLLLDRDDPTPDTVNTPPTPMPSGKFEFIGDHRTQPVWDPFDLPAAPRRDSTLPTTLAAPEAAPSITGDPLPDIVVAWPEAGRDLRLLGSNGEWRSVPGTATAIEGSLYDVVWPTISPDGDRVAMSTDAGILVVDASGDLETISWPPELAGPFDTRPALLWRPGDEGFVVQHWERPWFVGVDGSGEPAPFGGKLSSGSVMVDPDDGTVREKRWQRNDLVEWNGDTAENRVPVLGYGERLVTRFGLVAYTGAPAQNLRGQKSGPVVLDVTTGDVVGYAPIRDTSSVYSDNGYLTAQGFLDAETVLLLVGPMDYRTMDPGEEQWHLVAWHFRRGDFELITSGDTGMRTIEVVPDLL